jgi:hypothetical protein
MDSITILNTDRRPRKKDKTPKTRSEKKEDANKRGLHKAGKVKLSQPRVCFGSGPRKITAGRAKKRALYEKKKKLEAKNIEIIYVSE